MINRLINLEIIPPMNKKAIPNLHSGKYTTEEYAIAFISGMGESQQKRFKQMLQNNIPSGMGVAESYGVDYEEFIKEVKKHLKVEV